MVKHHNTAGVDLAEAKRLRGVVAQLMVDDPVYTPIFERLDRMVEELMAARDVNARARRIAERQRDLAELI